MRYYKLVGKLTMPMYPKMGNQRIIGFCDIPIGTIFTTQPAFPEILQSEIGFDGISQCYSSKSISVDISFLHLFELVNYGNYVDKETFLKAFPNATDEQIEICFKNGY